MSNPTKTPTPETKLTHEEILKLSDKEIRVIFPPKVVKEGFVLNMSVLEATKITRRKSGKVEDNVYGEAVRFVVTEVQENFDKEMGEYMPVNIEYEVTIEADDPTETRELIHILRNLHKIKDGFFTVPYNRVKDEGSRHADRIKCTKNAKYFINKYSQKN